MQHVVCDVVCLGEWTGIMVWTIDVKTNVKTNVRGGQAHVEDERGNMLSSASGYITTISTEMERKSNC